MENNPAERSKRAIAAGPNNYLFVGSEAGTNAVAIAFTLIETAKLNAVDPHAPRLADTLVPHPRTTKINEPTAMARKRPAVRPNGRLPSQFASFC